MGHRVGELARHLGGELLGPAELEVERIAPLAEAGPGSITFIAQAKFRPLLADSAAACVIAAPAQREAAEQRVAAGRGAVILCTDPYLAFARLTQWWAARTHSHTRARPAPGVHPSAIVEAGVSLPAGVHVGALAYVGAGARLGEGAVVREQAHVGAGAVVGERTVLMPRAQLGEGCRIGARGLVHGGAVIGADGFGFAPHEGRWEKIEQLGSVAIGDDVEIGANTCIDRGALGDTVLADGVKLDNLVQIAHNVQVGAHTAFAGCAAVAGSTRIGAHCTIGGAARIIGHLEITDHVHISATTLVSRSILKPGHYSGAFPFDDNASWEKNAATLRQLHSLRDRLRAVEKALDLARAGQPLSKKTPS
ncbi:MAG: UDP-3-O-(3-hydroxymyristoyl)glucosamine N-acyltransferase [Betaproteobacteria bacterium]|nr:UDP-3-O-(3-hydroxymyristoyl)glucosamine N-acyltransferase [Betaproteobacteria bacterium]